MAQNNVNSSDAHNRTNYFKKIIDSWITLSSSMNNETKKNLLTEIVKSESKIDGEIIKNNIDLQSFIIHELGLKYVLELLISNKSFVFNNTLLFKTLKIVNSINSTDSNYLVNPSYPFCDSESQNIINLFANYLAKYNELHCTSSRCFCCMANLVDLYCYLLMDSKEFLFVCDDFFNTNKIFVEFVEFVLHNLECDNFYNNVYSKHQTYFEKYSSVIDAHENFICNSMIKIIVSLNKTSIYEKLKQIVLLSKESKIFMRIFFETFILLMFEVIKYYELEQIKSDIDNDSLIFTIICDMMDDYHVYNKLFSCNLEFKCSQLSDDIIKKNKSDIEYNIKYNNFLKYILTSPSFFSKKEQLLTIFRKKTFGKLLNIISDDQIMSIYQKFDVMPENIKMKRTEFESNIINFILKTQHIFENNFELSHKLNTSTLDWTINKKHILNLKNIKDVFELVSYHVTYDEYKEIKLVTIVELGIINAIPKNILLELLIDNLQKLVFVQSKSNNANNTDNINNSMGDNIDDNNDNNKNIILIIFLIINFDISILQDFMASSFVEKKHLEFMIFEAKKISKINVINFLINCDRKKIEKLQDSEFVTFFSFDEMVDLVENNLQRAEDDLICYVTKFYPNLEKKIIENQISDIESKQQIILKNMSKKRTIAELFEIDNANLIMSERSENSTRETNYNRNPMMCNICCAEKINNVYVKCGHVICRSCVNRTNNKCPYCRTTSGIVKLII